jgi:hypothetical protein
MILGARVKDSRLFLQIPLRAEEGWERNAFYHLPVLMGRGLSQGR